MWLNPGNTKHVNFRKVSKQYLIKASTMGRLFHGLVHDISNCHRTVRRTNILFKKVFKYKYVPISKYSQLLAIDRPGKYLANQEDRCREIYGEINKELCKK